MRRGQASDQANWWARPVPAPKTQVLRTEHAEAARSRVSQSPAPAPILDAPTQKRPADTLTDHAVAVSQHDATPISEPAVHHLRGRTIAISLRLAEVLSGQVLKQARAWERYGSRSGRERPGRDWTTSVGGRPQGKEGSRRRVARGSRSRAWFCRRSLVIRSRSEPLTLVPQPVGSTAVVYAPDPAASPVRPVMCWYERVTRR